jgi:hypothetical protein
LAGAAAAADGGQLRDGRAAADGAGDLGRQGEQVGNPSATTPSDNDGSSFLDDLMSVTSRR